MLRVFIIGFLCITATTGLGQSTGLLNRIVSTIYSSEHQNWRIAFTDADSGEVVSYPLPSGVLPGSLVAMDRNGDVWIDDYNSTMIWKLSAVDGSLLAVANPTGVASFLITDAQGNLLVASRNFLTGLAAAIYVERFTTQGTFIGGVDLRTLFAPGQFYPATVLNGLPLAFTYGVQRMLVDRSGSIWLHAVGANYNPLIRLNPNLSLAASYPVYGITAIVPDQSDGVWVLQNNTGLQYTTIMAPPLVGVPLFGWVHMTNSGQLVETSGLDGHPGGYAGAQSQGHMRADGRTFQDPNPGLLAISHLKVHKPTNPPVPWYAPRDSIYLPSNAPVSYFMGFHLDGAQRVWVVGHGHANMATPSPAMTYQMRFPIEPPYTKSLTVEVGETCRAVPFFLETRYWSTYWGNPTLFEYVFYTDPLGDLDGDGVPNNVELANFSNALLPYGYSSAVTATATAPALGSTFTINYTVRGERDLAYAAPFAIQVPFTTVLGGGRFLPINLMDPLVLYSLQPSPSGMTGTLGNLTASGEAAASVTIPNDPTLLGMTLATCLVTHDPDLGTPLSTVSRLFEFTIQ